jgi:hypothetical protein
MEDVGILDMDNSFQKNKFITIYFSILQHVMDGYVVIRKQHGIVRINECGHFQNNHVLAKYFYEFEWLQGWRSHYLMTYCMLMFHLMKYRHKI